jgi:hypothetical protein
MIAVAVVPFGWLAFVALDATLAAFCTAVVLVVAVLVAEHLTVLTRRLLFDCGHKRRIATVECFLLLGGDLFTRRRLIPGYDFGAERTLVRWLG